MKMYFVFLPDKYFSSYNQGPNIFQTIAFAYYYFQFYYISKYIIKMKFTKSFFYNYYLCSS